MAPTELHPGTKGFSDAASYDAHRPSYPPDATQRFLEQLRIADAPHARVVDLAAGTGKLTEVLAARHEGFEIVGVEPHREMREELERKGLRGVEVRDGFAAATGLEAEWGDACVVGQAFHWFANEDALKEIHRILKPTAVLGLIWNIEDYNKPKHWKASTAWEQSLNELVFTLADDQPRFREFVWKDIFDRQLDANPLRAVRDIVLEGGRKMPLFSVPVGEDRVPFSVWLTPEALWKRVSTLSQVALLRGERAAAFKAKFDEILAGESVERNGKGEVALHGVTYFAWSSRL
ncbi:putative methyltransferase-like [Colletotrichum sidae]|uniref:Putative methyltransferase-like n=2 Tax=Colletotrichum orbiculare species complex TaxID=2707354 RepID=A0A4R8QBJ5_9PEZI|nr:putative methyltransferase-like [Colletotrichum spinosum]TEA18853.1 putative methyltransferase-like [Colletotrichum sidae]